MQERLALAEREKQDALALVKSKIDNEMQKAASAKDAEIAALKSEVERAELTKTLAISEALGAVEKQRDQLGNRLEVAELEKAISEKALEAKYQTQIKDRDDAIERLRDMKARLSTKMIGESLEVHCETEFNRIRATAFPRAYFEKDNDARSGSKGDYIFRDADDAGTEIISIMFEMKNEDDLKERENKEDDKEEKDNNKEEEACENHKSVNEIEVISNMNGESAHSEDKAAENNMEENKKNDELGSYLLYAI